MDNMESDYAASPTRMSLAGSIIGSPTAPSVVSVATERGMWSTLEHDKFLAALKLYPDGPWRAVAEFVGSRSSRQVQTHAQKYYAKVSRRVRGLRKDRKRVLRSEHRLDDVMAGLCEDIFIAQQQQQQQEQLSRCGVSPSKKASSDHVISNDTLESTPALALHTRRELHVLAMRRHCRRAKVDVKMENKRLHDDTTADIDLKMNDASEQPALPEQLSWLQSELHESGSDRVSGSIHNSSDHDSDSDSSMSVLDDDFIDYLLQIIDTEDNGVASDHHHDAVDDASASRRAPVSRVQ